MRRKSRKRNRTRKHARTRDAQARATPADDQSGSGRSRLCAQQGRGKGLEIMKIDGETLQTLFKPGGQLDGATVHTATIYGENYGDGSADGCAVYFWTRAGGFAMLLLDTTEADAMTARFLSTDAEYRRTADDHDRRAIAELEAQAAEIRRTYPVLQAIHEAAQTDAARRAALDD